MQNSFFDWRCSYQIDLNLAVPIHKSFERWQLCVLVYAAEVNDLVSHDMQGRKKNIGVVGDEALQYPEAGPIPTTASRELVLCRCRGRRTYGRTHGGSLWRMESLRSQRTQRSLTDGDSNLPYSAPTNHLANSFMRRVRAQPVMELAQETANVFDTAPTNSSAIASL